MVEIIELPDSLRNPDNIKVKDVPQLKYVVEMSEKLCRDVGCFLAFNNNFFQGGTLIFLQRYFDDCIDTSFKTQFLQNLDLQKTLKAYNIDITAFWYLILFIKDYVDDEAIGEKKSVTAYSDLCTFASKLYEMEFYKSPLDDEYKGCKNEGWLKLRVGKHWYETTNDKTLYGVFEALCRYLRSMKRHKEKALIDGVWEETNGYEYEAEKEHLYSISQNQNTEIITIPETYKISYFTTYMRIFLKSFRTQNKDTHISTDKWLLISRVIFTIGYSSDIRYNKRKKNDSVTDMDFLKRNYKKERYKDEVRRKIYV